MSGFAHGMAGAAPYIVIGVQIAGGMAMFVIGGYFVDQWLGTEPWLLIVGALLGMVATGGILYKTVKQLDEQNRSNRKRRDA